VWNPTTTVQFTIPAAFRSVSMQDIFGNVTAVAGNTVTVGDSPILLTSAETGPHRRQ
jgi:hypothetical protein